MAGGIYSVAVKGREAVPFIVFPVLMAGFGYVIFKKIIFDLVDEVYDGGDFLLVRDNRGEDRIQLSNIRNVSYSPLMSPQRVTLSLREAGIFGRELSFTLPIRFTLNFLKKDPIIEDLINRVESARNR
jgi:hypothetical protein